MEYLKYLRYLIISDLHLGDGSAADDSGNNDQKLINWIKQFKVDVVILNGDTFELVQFNMKEIQKAHKLLLDYLKSIGAVFIKGNHDDEIPAEDDMTVTMSNKEVAYITHGDAWDKNIKNPLLEGIVRFFKHLERIPFLHWIDNPEKYAKRAVEKVRKKTLKYAKKLLKKYKMVLCGHVHIFDLIKFPDGKIYGNSKDCMHGNYTGFILDANKCTLRKV